MHDTCERFKLLVYNANKHVNLYMLEGTTRVYVCGCTDADTCKFNLTRSILRLLLLVVNTSIQQFLW